MVEENKASESEPKIVESALSEPKRRGWKPKNKDDTLKPEIKDVVKGKTRGQKPKKEMKYQMLKHQKMW